MCAPLIFPAQYFLSQCGHIPNVLPRAPGLLATTVQTRWISPSPYFFRHMGEIILQHRMQNHWPIRRWRELMAQHEIIEHTLLL